MSHECIDWEAAPPRPKTPFIIISYGGAKVVARRGEGSKVQEFKALQTFAHRNFSIQGCSPTSLRFRTTCNLGCAPIKRYSYFEVNGEAWEDEGLRDLVGCLEVLLDEHEATPGAVKLSQAESDFSLESQFEDWGMGRRASEILQPEDEHQEDQIHKPARISDQRQEVGRTSDDMSGDGREEIICKSLDQSPHAMSDKASKKGIASQSGPSDRELGVVAVDVDRETPNHMLAINAGRKRKANIDSNLQPSTSAANAGSKDSDFHLPDFINNSDTERLTKRKKILIAYRSSVAESRDDSRAPGASQSIDVSVKQEQISAAQMMPQPESSQTTREAELNTELSTPKVVISIQHEPSTQHAQFSVRPYTRVGKVLAGACKSFRLDGNVAQLYLVVATQNEEGLKEQDYFLCDRDDTMENAIAGMNERAEFIIRMPGDSGL